MIILILFNCSYLYTQKNHPYASNIAASSERCARGNFSNAYHSDISVYNFLPAYRCWNLKSKILSSEIKTVKYEERATSIWITCNLRINNDILVLILYTTIATLSTCILQVLVVSILLSTTSIATPPSSFSSSSSYCFISSN